MTALDLIQKIADVNLEKIKIRAPELKGHNGPYHHPQTLVRNLSHWLVTCSRLAEWTDQSRYRTAAEACAEFLLSDEARPNQAAFDHRSSKDRDRCNGLIGPAWTFEALLAASRLFGDEEFLELGRQVFSLYPLDRTEGLWKVMEVDGELRSFDKTFNHQLWFACVSWLLGKELKDEGIQSDCRVFFDRMPQNLTVLDSGLILHKSHRQFANEYRAKTGLRARFRALKAGLKRGKVDLSCPLSLSRFIAQKEENLREKSVGYHAFNTLAFSLVRKSLNHSFWASDEFSRLRDYLKSDDYHCGALNERTYGFPYNPLGFEVPVSLYFLDDILPEDAFIEQSSNWLNEQLKRTFDPVTMLFSRNNEDPATLTARIYELTYLPQGCLERIRLEVPA